MMGMKCTYGRAGVWRPRSGAAGVFEVALTSAANAAKRQECKAAYQAQLDQWISENRDKFDENLAKAKESFANWEKTTYAKFLETLKK